MEEPSNDKVLIKMFIFGFHKLNMMVKIFFFSIKIKITWTVLHNDNEICASCETVNVFDNVWMTQILNDLQLWVMILKVLIFKQYFIIFGPKGYVWPHIIFH